MLMKEFLIVDQVAETLTAMILETPDKERDAEKAKRQQRTD